MAFPVRCISASLSFLTLRLFLQLFDSKPSDIEDFAPYATELLPHRRELADNLQAVEYFSSLFEVKLRRR